MHIHASSSTFSTSIDILLIFYLLYFTRHTSFLGGGGEREGIIMMKTRVKCTDFIINWNLLQIFSYVGFKKIASHLKI